MHDAPLWVGGIGGIVFAADLQQERKQQTKGLLSVVIIHTAFHESGRRDAVPDPHGPFWAAGQRISLAV